MKNTYMVYNNLDLADLTNNLSEFLKRKGLSVQSFKADNTTWVVQAKEESWKKYVSMDKAITVKLSLNLNALSVEIGSGKWIDKAAGAAVAWFLFWPTLITTAIGTYQQMQLPKEIEGHIVNYLSQNRSHTNVSRFCSSCGNAITGEGDRFCDKCGSDLKS